MNCGTNGPAFNRFWENVLMSGKLPLISCLCITRNRVPLLKRAIASFNAQTYDNKELIIVYEDDDPSTKDYLQKLSAPDIHKIEMAKSPDLTLGKLRNLSIQACNGEFFCQWDDDDWYHHHRLEFQMYVIRQSRFPACVLMHWLVFDATRNRGYVSPWWPWEGSVLCQTKIFDDDMKYADKKKDEDTPFIKKMLKKHMVFPVIMPKLYIYVYHSANVCGYDHWRDNIFRASKALSAPTSRLMADILNGRYSVKEASELLDDIEG